MLLFVSVFSVSVKNMVTYVMLAIVIFVLVYSLTRNAPIPILVSGIGPILF